MLQTVNKITEGDSASFVRMNSLGLTVETLAQSIWSGLFQHRSTSKLEPLNAAGSKAYFAIVKALREQLLANGKGWSKLEHNGQSLLVNPENSITIMATSGDKYTGLDDMVSPCTKNGKGFETKNYVSKNLVENLELFEDYRNLEQLSDINDAPADGNQLWVLLYHFDFGKKEVRFELSLPIGIREFGKNGKVKVSEWADRLLFEPISFTSPTFNHQSPTFNDDIAFNIKPKE